MGFIGQQIQQMMINKITQSNPHIAPYINRIQGGENYSNVLSDAINNGDITRQQFNQVKGMLPKLGQQYGINISQQDIAKLESAFNESPGKTNSNFTGGFRF